MAVQENDGGQPTSATQVANTEHDGSTDNRSNNWARGILGAMTGGLSEAVRGLSRTGLSGEIGKVLDMAENFWRDSGLHNMASRAGSQTVETPDWDKFFNEYNRLAREATEADRAFQMTEAEKAREWQKMMSDTEIQRRMEDMRRAGLNPLFALGGGFSGHTPSAAQVSRTSPASVHGQNVDLMLLLEIMSMMPTNMFSGGSGGSSFRVRGFS